MKQQAIQGNEIIGSLEQLLPGLIEHNVEACFAADSPLVLLLKGGDYCSMQMTLNLADQTHRELGFWSIVRHGFAHDSDQIFLCLPCWFNPSDGSLSLSHLIEEHDEDHIPVIAAVSVNSDYEVVDGYYFKVFSYSLSTSVFPHGRIPESALEQMAEALNIKALSESDPRLSRAKLELATPVWGPSFRKVEHYH